MPQQNIPKVIPLQINPETGINETHIINKSLTWLGVFSNVKTYSTTRIFTPLLNSSKNMNFDFSPDNISLISDGITIGANGLENAIETYTDETLTLEEQDRKFVVETSVESFFLIAGAIAGIIAVSTIGSLAFMSSIPILLGIGIIAGVSFLVPNIVIFGGNLPIIKNGLNNFGYKIYDFIKEFASRNKENAIYNKYKE